MATTASFIIKKLPKVAIYIRKKENAQNKKHKTDKNLMRTSLIWTSIIGATTTLYLNNINIVFSIWTSFLISVVILLMVIFVMDGILKAVKPKGL